MNSKLTWLVQVQLHCVISICSLQSSEDPDDRQTRIAEGTSRSTLWQLFETFQAHPNYHHQYLCHRSPYVVRYVLWLNRGEFCTGFSSGCVCTPTVWRTELGKVGCGRHFDLFSRTLSAHNLAQQWEWFTNMPINFLPRTSSHSFQHPQRWRAPRVIILCEVNVVVNGWAWLWGEKNVFLAAINYYKWLEFTRFYRRLNN